MTADLMRRLHVIAVRSLCHTRLHESQKICVQPVIRYGIWPRMRRTFEAATEQIESLEDGQPDSRLVALVRLLARKAADQDFDRWREGKGPLIERGHRTNGSE